uniref:Serpentine receptor class gamma n=1 Tax=Meloidogyne enterolobii TaxID=390850 RepID=A0A6V7TQW5_MELEN|nr:unnamed protein product [Meloidogyne enterolobii]
MSFQIFLWLSSLRNQFIYFAIAISLPSMLLYLIEILTIIRHKEFHNPFYKLVLIRSIPNILYTLDSYYCYRLTILFGNFLYPLYSQLPNWMLRLSYFLTFYTMIADFLVTILLLLNRWTAITMAMNYKKFWRKMLLPSAILVFGLPTLLYAQEFTVNGFLQNDTSDGSFSFYLAQDFNPIYDAFPLTICYCVAFISISVVINIGTLISYRKHAKLTSSIKNNQQLLREKTEYKLLLYAILTFVGHAVMAFEQVLTYLVVNSNNFDFIAAVYTQYPWTMDVGSVVMPSWLLFWASDTFRQKILKDFCPKWLESLTRRKTTVQPLQTTMVVPVKQGNNFSA